MWYIYTVELWCYIGVSVELIMVGMGVSLTSSPACKILSLLFGWHVQTHYEGFHFGFLYLLLSYLASPGVLFFSEEKTQRGIDLGNRGTRTTRERGDSCLWCVVWRISYFQFSNINTMFPKWKCKEEGKQ